MWSSHSWSEESDNTFDDDGYGIEDIVPETMEEFWEDCLAFWRENRTLLKDYDPGQLGHDFWLSRNGHGAGFLEGNGSKGNMLQRMA